MLFMALEQQSRDSHAWLAAPKYGLIVARRKYIALQTA